MRVLKPEVAEGRRKKILNWVVHQYVRTSKPVSSEFVAEKSGFNISSATIRNVLKELEENNYLYHSHTSGGRIPTDRGYRAYVDYVMEMQRMAVRERERIEKEYTRQMEETDQLMLQTSKILSVMSKSAGFVLSPDVGEDYIRRVDMIPLGVRRVLAVLVTQSGIIRHWPINLNSDLDTSRLRLLGTFLNHRISGLTLGEARRILWEDMGKGNAEIRDVEEITMQLLDDFERCQQSSDTFYMEGLSRLSEGMSAGDFTELRSMFRVVEEKKRFSEVLRERLKECMKEKGITVTIGSENEIKEFRNFTLVSSSYRIKDKVLGLVGILGPKRMEYPKVISLVNIVGEMLSQTLEQWERTFLPIEHPLEPALPAEQSRIQKVIKNGAFAGGQAGEKTKKVAVNRISNEAKRRQRNSPAAAGQR